MKKAFVRISKWPIWRWYGKWEWLIISFGLITILFLFLNLFTDFTDNTPPPYKSKDLTLDDPPNLFLSTIASSINSTIEEGTPTKILTNGYEFLPDVLDEINNAQKNIYITNYIWDDGEFGNALFKALIEKAKAGVDVNVLLDGVAGRHASSRYIKELKKNGGNVAFFRPLRWWNISRIDKRTHVRDFVIDDKIAYIGGIAISDPWLGNATSSTSWHDFMFKFGGNMAKRSSMVFNNIWSQTTGEILTLENDEFATLSTSTTKFVPLLSIPGPDVSSNMEHFMWLSINAATSSIYIEDPYLLPNDSILDALKKKSEQGVDVEIITPGPNTDARHVRWASRSFYPTLIRSGVKIYEYQPSRIHSKTVVVDGKWSIIGSANMDNRSSEINLEYVMGVMDENLGKDLINKFQIDKNSSEEVNRKDIHSSFFALPIQYLSRLFIHQY